MFFARALLLGWRGGLLGAAGAAESWRVLRVCALCRALLCLRVCLRAAAALPRCVHVVVVLGGFGVCFALADLATTLAQLGGVGQACRQKWVSGSACAHACLCVCRRCGPGSPTKVGSSTIIFYRFGRVFLITGWCLLTIPLFVVFLSLFIVIFTAPILRVRRHGFLWIMSEGSAGAVCSQE